METMDTNAEPWKVQGGVRDEAGEVDGCGESCWLRFYQDHGKLEPWRSKAGHLCM